MNARPACFDPVHTGLRWQHRFHALGPRHYTALAPQPLPEPYWVGHSPALAAALGFPGDDWRSDELLQAFSGNRPIAGTRPLASVYSGHQFGHWAGQLGDGRAILLGELAGQELQLKGSGLTPYSRMGDGRAVLRSSIREFLASEAMHALGVPTTRALCVTGSDAPVQRERVETAAVVTRVAPSFIRFGHFEHFAALGELDALRALADHVIENHVPECADATGGARYVALLQAVVERTAVLVAHWQALGFCHGVLNTDNMSILGLTLDYGPFQFLDGFDPGHVCNHSDRLGRYAFDRQRDVCHWNLACLARALLPLIGEPGLALAALDAYQPRFQSQYGQRMAAKLGLVDVVEGDGPIGDDDAALLRDLLALLATERTDYTIFWRRLSQVATDPTPVRELFIDRTGFEAWLQRYRQRLSPLDPSAVATLMRRSNPKFVLRNHLAEQAIAAAQDKDYTVLQRLQQVLAAPYDEHEGCEDLAALPPAWASQIEISCSS